MALTNTLGSALSSLGNLVLGGVQKTLRFGAGSLQGPSLPYFSYRIYDPVSGALLISNLPHPHRSKWTIKALQPGNTSTAGIGDYDIPLFGPEDDEYRKAAPIYALLAEGQRVEGYIAPSPNVEPSGGLPLVSGVIRSTPTDLSTMSIKGVDTLFLLQSSRTLRTEFFSGRTDQLAALALRGYLQTYLDDFSSASLAAYAQTGPRAWATSTDEGLPVATVSGDSSSAPSLLTTGNFAQSTYADCFIDNYFRLVFASNSSSGLASFGGGSAGPVSSVHGIAAAMSGGAGVLGYLNARFISAAKWEVDLVIATVASGVITPRVTKTLVVVEPTNAMRGQLTLIGKQGTSSGSTFTPSPSGPDYLWRVTLNGVDAGCTWVQLATTPSGGVGFAYASAASPTGSPQLWGTQLCFFSRLNVMQQGITNTGARSVLQYVPRTAMLDLLNYASVTESFVYRKNPGVGLNQDTVDWGPPAGAQQPGQTAVGSDSIARFVFGLNLKEYSQEENSDPLATDISLQLSPSGDHAGILNWHVISAMRKYGVLTDTVQAQYLADFLSARALAQVIGATKSTPGLSKKFKVLRDPDTAGLVRELDYIVIHHPEFRPPIINQRVQVLEWTITEGDPYVDIVGDKFPAETFGVELARLWQTLDQVAIGSSQLTPSSVGTGLVYDSRFGSPQVLPFAGPYLSVDSSHNYRMRFQIPNNVALIQKVTLAFSLLPYRTYSSFSLSSTGAGSSHSHAMGTSGAGSAHKHTLSIPVGGGVATLNVATGGPIQWGGPGSTVTDTNTVQTEASHSHVLGTSGTEASHTHSVSGSSTLGIAEGAVAQGVHVLVDSVDVTAALSTPGPYGSGGAQDFGEYDITPYILGGGWHEIQFSSTTLGAIVAQGMMYVIVKPTGT